jgi:hypothetical protein
LSPIFSYIINTTNIGIDYIIEEAGRAKERITIVEGMKKAGLTEDVIAKVIGTNSSELKRKLSHARVKE